MRSLFALALIASATAAGPAAADCTCRAFGRNFELGMSVCLATPAGNRLATCGMVLNNSSWDISSTPCAAAGLQAAAGARKPLPPHPRQGS